MMKVPLDDGRVPVHGRGHRRSHLVSSVAEDVSVGERRLQARLTDLWETPHTWLARLATVDHKTLGKRYIYTAFVFFALGGIEAAIMRAQLARPDNRLLSPQAYNQLFTMHGVTMMFLFAQPVLSGFSFYLTPLMIGSRELAFPRLNTFSYYVFLLAGAFIYASFLIGQAPNAGWFNYTPLSSTLYNTGLNIDFYTLGLAVPRRCDDGRSVQLDRHAFSNCARRACRSTACRCSSGAR